LFALASEASSQRERPKSAAPDPRFARRRGGSKASRWCGRVPVIHDDVPRTLKFIMDHRNSGLPELRILRLKSATADLSVSQRRPLASLPRR